jgi:long-chain acyl-CoA synthetase
MVGRVHQHTILAGCDDARRVNDQGGTVTSSSISTIADIIRVHGAGRGDSPALEIDGRSVSFGELDRRSNQVAQALRAAGVGRDDRVAFIDKNGLEWFEVTFGVAKLAAVNVSVNWRLAPPEMAQIIEDAHASIVIVGPEFVGHIEKVESELPGVRTIVAIGGHDRWQDYEAWVAAQPAEDPGETTGPDDVGFQLYTSGTTGLPKGVMLTNDNFFGGVMGIAEQWRFTADSVNLAMMPMFHIAGAGWSMVGLYFGCRTVVLRDVDPARILQVIPEFGVTNAFMVPAVIQFLLMTPGVESTDFSTLRALVYGASPITDKVLVQGIKTFGCEFIQVYGLTETTGAITQLDGDEHDPENRPHLLRSCGKPYPWVEFRIVDGDGNDVPVGTVGELWTRSHQNMKGYWQNPEATSQAVTPDGWFKTGDAGYADEDGYLYLHDRVKDMIVSGGENVYPAEVENALMQHPGIADVAVIGVPDDKWGEAVKAIVVKAADAEPTETDIIAFARERLAGYKLPKSVDFAEVLPRNPSGKLLKRELREPYWAGVQRRIG